VEDIRIRFGVPADRRSLEEMQRRASLAVEEYRAALLAHPEAIRLPGTLLAERRVRVAEMESEPVGFAVLLPPKARICELDGLFVEPAHWRRGVGRALLIDAVDIARAAEGRTIEVTANQRDEAFYWRFGFVRVASVETQFGPATRMRYALISRPYSASE